MPIKKVIAAVCSSSEESLRPKRDAQASDLTPSLYRASMSRKQLTVYVLGLVACAVAAIAIALLAPASSTQTALYELQLRAADSNWELNNGNAEGAPQQQVVNGWAAKDLLEIQIQQNNDLLGLAARQDNRGRLLLMVLTVGVMWIGAWQPLLRRRPNTAEPPTEPPAAPWVSYE